MGRFTRRTLIAGAAALAAAGEETHAVRLPRKLRVAILGFEGHTSEIIQPLPRLPDVEVTAICDSSAQALERAARNPRLAKAARYSDYRRMLETEKLDLVAVCNDNGARAEAILACAARKLDVIAEKPLAIRRSDFERVRSAVAANKIRLGMLLPMRFDSEYLALRQAVAQGLIGEVAQIGAQKSYKAGSRAPWFLKRSSYGGTILWIGIHMVDLMRFTSGREFREAAGFQGHIGFPELGEMENVTASLFRLDNGGVGTRRMDYLRSPTAATHGDDRLRLAGTRGVLEYQAATGVTLMSDKTKPQVMENLPARASVFVDFLESAYNGKPAALPLADIYRVNEIVLGAQQAADEGRIVRL